MNINLTLLAQAATFAVFVVFTWKFVWPPLLRAIEARQKQIADGLAAGERGRHDLELAQKRSTDAIREAKEKAMEVIAQGEKRAAQIIDEAKGAARVEGDRIVAGAKAEIEKEVLKAKEMLKNQVAALAVAGAEKILRKEIDAAKHADLLAGIKQEL